MNEIDTDMIAKEELKEVNIELKAVEAQIEQLLERQQELLERRKCLEDQVLNGEACSLKQNCANSDPAAWRGCDFPWCKDMEDAKERVFKISKFRPLQLETMNATMSGVDCILVMPTGGGKSLCFQLPAVISSGITLVVSPLVSLMEDQLMALQVTENNKVLRHIHVCMSHGLDCRIPPPPPPWNAHPLDQHVNS